MSRDVLAARLTELRAAAGLSGNALAGRMNIVQSRVWKIEHGKLLPSEHDLIAWAEATGATSEVADELAAMLAEARKEQAFGTTLRGKGGAAAFEDRIREVEQGAERIGEFQVGVVPGLLHTADYLREVVSLPAGLRTWGADGAEIEAKIAARLRRQEVLTQPGKRVQQVMSEAALRIRPTSPEIMAAQLGKLLSVIRLPSVELGVIGFGERMPAYALGSFRVYDDDLVVVESITGEKEYRAESDPAEVGAYLEAFDALRQAARTGDGAEALIRQALEDMLPLPLSTGQHRPSRGRSHEPSTGFLLTIWLTGVLALIVTASWPRSSPVPPVVTPGGAG